MLSLNSAKVALLPVSYPTFFKNHALQHVFLKSLRITAQAIHPKNNPYTLQETIISCITSPPCLKKGRPLRSRKDLPLY